jgi:hypothetical protein
LTGWTGPTDECGPAIKEETIEPTYAAVFVEFVCATDEDIDKENGQKEVEAGDNEEQLGCHSDDQEMKSLHGGVAGKVYAGERPGAAVISRDVESILFGRGHCQLPTR